MFRVFFFFLLSPSPAMFTDASCVQYSRSVPATFWTEALVGRSLDVPCYPKIVDLVSPKS